MWEKRKETENVSYNNIFFYVTSFAMGPVFKIQQKLNVCLSKYRKSKGQVKAGEKTKVKGMSTESEGKGKMNGKQRDVSGK